MKKITFKEYLLEFDYGDRQLQQQVTQQQQQAAADKSANNAFSQNMSNAAPSKGDIIESKNGRFVVLGGSMDGIKVKEIGGNRSGTVPHSTKFENKGKAESGKTVFAVVPQTKQ